MNETWKEKREIFLRLGTHQYERPAQLPLCEAVSDVATNKLLNAENHVEPIGDFAIVYSEKSLYINALPSVKEGFKIDARERIK